MSRRFQFSLRALLVAAAVVPLMLGGAHLFSGYAQYIEVGPVQVDGSTVIEGRIVRFFGPLDLEYCLEVDGRPEHEGIWSFGIARRKWLCIYPIQRDYDFSRRPPGQYRLTLIGGDPRENAQRGAATTVVIPERL
ncbi:MAG TPA: hypothetical protein PK867_26470 [Pirellulales bacterium]|nr:hypothetical protein [Pirellulales bacterium]